MHRQRIDIRAAAKRSEAKSGMRNAAAEQEFAAGAERPVLDPAKIAVRLK